MSKNLFVLLFLFLTISSYSLEKDLPNINVPTQMEMKEFAFVVQHRFYGDVTDNPIGNHFGIDYGANVGLKMRYVIWSKLELKAGYTAGPREYSLGGSYAVEINPLYLRTQIDIEYFDYYEGVNNFFYLLSLQSDLLPDLLSVAVNLGYDAENSKTGMGFGADIGFNFDFNYIQRISLIGEYYPILGEDNGLEHSFSFGLKAETFGHLFMLLLGNNTGIGTRRAMLGAPSNTLHLGFKICRYINF